MTIQTTYNNPVARVAPEKTIRSRPPLFRTTTDNVRLIMQNQPAYIPKWKGSEAQIKRNAQIMAHIIATEKQLKGGK